MAGRKIIIARQAGIIFDQKNENSKIENSKCVIVCLLPNFNTNKLKQCLLQHAAGQARAQAPGQWWCPSCEINMHRTRLPVEKKTGPPGGVIVCRLSRPPILTPKTTTVSAVRAAGVHAPGRWKRLNCTVCMGCIGRPGEKNKRPPGAPDLFGVLKYIPFR
jgi:hypothetical protein